MESKEVTIEMIDDALVVEIVKALAPTFQADYLTFFVAVRGVLAWLANHPLPLTQEQIHLILSSAAMIDKYGAATVTSNVYAVEIALNWQRIAFLKKEELVPNEVKELLVQDAMIAIAIPSQALDAKIMNERIVKAYKLGKEANRE